MFLFDVGTMRFLYRKVRKLDFPQKSFAVYSVLLEIFCPTSCLGLGKCQRQIQSTDADVFLRILHKWAVGFKALLTHCLLNCQSEVLYKMKDQTILVTVDGFHMASTRASFLSTKGPVLQSGSEPCPQCSNGSGYTHRDQRQPDTSAGGGRYPATQPSGAVPATVLVPLGRRHR